LSFWIRQKVSQRSLNILPNYKSYELMIEFSDMVGFVFTTNEKYRINHYWIYPLLPNTILDFNLLKLYVHFLRNLYNLRKILTKGCS